MCRGVVLGLVSPGLDPAYSPAVVAQEALSTRCSQAFLPLPDPVCTPDQQNPGCKRNGADQDTVHDDVVEGGLQAQSDAPAGELLADRVVVATDGDHADGIDGAVDFHGCTGGELGPGRPGRWRPGGAGTLSAQPGQVDAASSSSTSP